jgi:hypothetical protein
MRERGRNLSNPEVDLVVHLHKAGAAHTPVRVLATAIKTAMTLRKLGIVHAWSRYAEGRGSEGPFFTLTSTGLIRAESLYLARQRQAARPPAETLYQSRPVQSERSNPTEGDC